MYCACFVRVLLCFSVVHLAGHTVYTASFLHVHARKHMLAASVVAANRRKLTTQNMQNSCTKHANIVKLLIRLHIYIKFSMPVLMFCFLRIELSHAYSRAVSLGGY